MKIVGLIPSKLNSERVPSKNIKELDGVPLVNYVVRTLNKVSCLEQTIIYASEPRICDYIEDDLNYIFLKRPNYLDTQQANIQDILIEFVKQIKADIIVLLHITSPFIKVETVIECIGKVSSGDYDSAFAAVSLEKFCWFQGRPLNYQLNGRIPRTQDADPVIVESCLYVFRQDFFEKTGQRNSDKPYIVNIDHFQGQDIDTQKDFEFAELTVKGGFLNQEK